MSHAKTAWTRIACFSGVTYAFSSIFMYLAVSNGKITAVTALGGMWSPFVGVFVTRMIFPDGRRRGSLAGLGWGWGKTHYQFLSYALPALYVLAAYAVVWLAGIGAVTSEPTGKLVPWLLKTMASGLLLGSVFAFGEEVGWQGYLVPQLFKIMGFTRTALLRGVIWSVWHYPLLLGGIYGTTDTPTWYRLTCFTITMTAISFAFTWLRMKSGNLWTGVIMHSTHNTFIQGVLPGITVAGAGAEWFVDEMGLFTAVAAVIVALVFWRKRGALAGR